jgi:hypothetical protein
MNDADINFYFDPLGPWHGEAGASANGTANTLRGER